MSNKNSPGRHHAVGLSKAPVGFLPSRGLQYSTASRQGTPSGGRATTLVAGFERRNAPGRSQSARGGGSLNQRGELVESIASRDAPAYRD